MIGKFIKNNAFLALAALLTAMPAFAQGDIVSAQTVVTVVPKNGEAASLTQQNLRVWTAGKTSEITSWQPLRGDRAGLEFVVLIDDSARTSIGLQLSELAKFIESMPPTAHVGVAYMQNGQAVFAQSMTADHSLAAKALRLTAGVSGGNASPYFCLSDLVKHWPSQDPHNRREVLMVTDGVDRYSPRYDPDDPYLQASISDAQKAGVIVYSIYFRDTGRFDNSGYETNAGQNLLAQLTDATGGRFYYQGFSNPVSFGPYLDDLNRRLNNQFELGFTAPNKGKAELVELKVKTDISHVEVDAAKQVPVGGGTR